jgi:1-deoxy-D-xylulose-5-phosphate reductoisomerase
MATSRWLGKPLPFPRRVAVLGSTGSIGRSALEVIAAAPQELRLAGITAHQNWERLAAQIDQFRPPWAVLTDGAAAPASATVPGTQLHYGVERLDALVSGDDVDMVLVAVVGAAGLRGSWAALEAGKPVALANKETLVVAGPLAMALAQRTGAAILPVDSEHSAIFQCLADHDVSDVCRVVLTASGGPFRGRSRTELQAVTVAEALNHPTWQMGPKITIDSATLMNKALEIIEARWLFDLAPEQIEVIVHPESIVHSFVEFRDGSVLAQLSPPDMRLPIQLALMYPHRRAGPTRRLDWSTLRQLNFAAPDRATLPALDLGFEVARRGGTSGAALNAANEVAVGRFLAGDLRFLDIVALVRDVVADHPFHADPALHDLLAVDAWARQEAHRWKPSRI